MVSIGLCSHVVCIVRKALFFAHTMCTMVGPYEAMKAATKIALHACHPAPNGLRDRALAPCFALFPPATPVADGLLPVADDTGGSLAVAYDASLLSKLRQSVGSGKAVLAIVQSVSIEVPTPAARIPAVRPMPTFRSALGLMCVRFPNMWASWFPTLSVALDGRQFLATLVTRSTVTESWGRSRKKFASAWPILSRIWMPRRIWGRKPALNVRPTVGAVAWKGRALIWVLPLYVGLFRTTFGTGWGCIDLQAICGGIGDIAKVDSHMRLIRNLYPCKQI
jgi:hypothetical protein